MGTTENELKQDAERQRARMGDTLDAIGDRLSPERMMERRKAAVGQRFRSIKDSVMGSPDYREPMMDRLRSAGESAGESVQSASERVQHAPQLVADQARGNPVAAGIVAFGAGMLVATVLPKSRTEQKLAAEAKPQLQHAAEELKGAGREVAEGAKEHAKEAVDEVKSAGSEATAKVRDQARDSAQHIRDDAGT